MGDLLKAIFKVFQVLQNKKEILIELIGALVLVFTSLGLAPDSIPLLKSLSDAIQAGDWGAAFAVLIAIVSLLARAAWRAKLNRVQPDRQDPSPVTRFSKPAPR